MPWFREILVASVEDQVRCEDPPRHTVEGEAVIATETGTTDCAIARTGRSGDKTRVSMQKNATFLEKLFSFLLCIFINMFLIIAVLKQIILQTYVLDM